MVELQKQDIWKKQKNFSYILFFGSKQNPVVYINKKDILESFLLRQVLCIFRIFPYFPVCLSEILTAFLFRIRELEDGDLTLPETHGQMHIPIHGNLDRGVSQHLAESFDLHTRFYAACGKGMTECMKVQIPDAAAFYDLFKMSSHLSWLHRG